MKIAVLVGSLSQASINKKLAQGIEKLLPEGVEFAYANLDLPLFNYELEADFPGDAQALKDLIESADGVLLVTPEYNRSFSGVLKNAIDWASRPWGTNSFNGKPAAIIGASGSGLATAQAQQSLRNVMLYLNTKLIGQPEVYFNATQGFDTNGELTEDSAEFLQKFVDAFVAHIQDNK
jgi:chromate reductase